jgi:hypothetical protein
MKKSKKWLGVILLAAGLQIVIFQPWSESGSPKNGAAKIEPLQDGISRITLTSKAAERLDIRTETVEEEMLQNDGGGNSGANKEAEAVRETAAAKNQMVGEDSKQMNGPKQGGAVQNGERDDRQLGAEGTKKIANSHKMKVIPYSALLYDPNGGEWMYTNPEPLVFVREKIIVDRIAGDKAILKKGPPVGTKVVTVGVTELYGAETGIGK